MVSLPGLPGARGGSRPTVLQELDERSAVLKSVPEVEAEDARRKALARYADPDLNALLAIKRCQ